MKYLKYYSRVLLYSSLVGIVAVSCVQDNLDPDNAPGVGGVEDLTPPEADFSFNQDVDDFTVFLLTNESISSTGQNWTIPADAVLVDGFSLTDPNVEVKFPGEGEFEVGLVATDDRPSSSEMLLQTIEVIEPEIPLIPIPEILSPGFEADVDNMISDARNAWGRNNSEAVKAIDDLSVFGISTGSRVRSGDQSAKFEDNSPRQAYQEITVTPNTEYRVSIYMKRGSGIDTVLEDEDEMRLAILGETFEAFDLALFEAAMIASKTGNPGEDFSRMFVDFDSGDRETVVIYLDSKSRIEVQVDDVEISVL